MFVKHSCRYIHRLHKSLANSVLSLSLSLVAVPFVCFPCWILLVFFGFLFQVIWPFLLACPPAFLPSFSWANNLFSAGVAICQSSSFNLLLCSSSSQVFLFSQGLRQLGIRSNYHFGCDRQAEICGFWFFVGRKKRRRLSCRWKECETLITTTTSAALERFLRILVLFHRL